MQLTRITLLASMTLIPCLTALAQEEQRLRKIVVKDEGVVATQIRSATKTNSTLLDVPQSISVIDRALIDDQSMRSMADIALYVPGMTMGQGEGHRDAPTLRGNSSTADFFINGVRDDVQYYRDLYNTERVEVLKGPNALIFGRGGGGGVINRVTAQADWETHRSLTLQGGSFDQKRITADVGQGLSDAFALRLTAVYEDSDSYRDFTELERYGLNPTMAWLLAPDTILRLSYERFHDERTVDRGIPSQNGRPVLIDVATFVGNPRESHAELTADLGTLTVEHAFSDKLILRNHATFADYSKYYQNIHANSAVSALGNVTLQGYYSGTARQNGFNQSDLTWQFTTGPINHTLLVGAEIGRQRTDNTRNPNSVPGTVNIASPTTFTLATFSPGLQTDNRVEADVTAAYLQDQIQLNEDWQIIVGLRYDEFDLAFNDKRPGSQDFSRRDNFFSPRAGIVYKPTPSFSIYSSYSVSYLPQSGDQFASLTATTAALDPEEFENLELGAKWSINPHLALSAAIYSLDRSNSPFVEPVTNFTVLTGKQKSEGVELELKGSLTEHWSIAAGYAYQDAKITHSTAAAPAGRSVPLVPDHQASLWNSYRISPTWRAAMGAVYQSQVFASLSNAVVLPSFARIDAALFVTLNDRFELQLNVENVLDRKYWRTAHNDNNITPGSPLAGRLSLSASF